MLKCHINTLQYVLASTKYNHSDTVIKNYQIKIFTCCTASVYYLERKIKHEMSLLSIVHGIETKWYQKQT